MIAQPWEPRVSHLEGACEQIADRLSGVDQIARRHFVTNKTIT